MAERTNPHANLIIGAQDEATPVFDKIKASSQSMAAGVEQAATKAAGAVGGIGDKAAPAAQKLDGVTASMIRQVQRLNAELEAGSARNAAYFEKMATLKGADKAALAPYLAQLKQAEAAQRIATTGLDQMGMSAKQTSAALRQVPMQFTDIVVSLQGGQSAMQVLMQQGGQLKDMFGGIGPAARAMGTYIVGLVNPLTIAAAAVAGLGFAMYSLNGKDAALRELSAQLIGTGRASAAAVGDIKSLVNELNTVPGVSKAAATAIIGEFAKVSGLGSSMFKDLGSSVADFAAATGTDLPTAAKKLAEAFADPAKGAKSLEDSLGTLTAAQILTITKMAEMGDKSGAQAALLDALKQATEGLAKQGMTPLGEATDKMSNAWDKLNTSVGNSSAFRTANDWLAKLIEKTAELTVRLSQMQPPTWLKLLPVVGPAIGAASLLAGPEANAGGSRSVSGTVGNMEGGATGSWGPTADDIEKQVKAALDLTRSYESQSAAMEKLRGVAKVANDALKALEAQSRGNSVEAKELRERIAGVNEKLAEMAKKGRAAPKGGDPFAADREAAKQWSSYVEKFTKAAADATAKSEGLTKSQSELVEYLQSPAYQNASEPMRAIALEAAYAAIAQEQLNDANKITAQVAKEAAKSHAQFVAELSKGANVAQQQADQLRTEEAAAVIAADGYYSLAQAIELVTIARLKEKRDGLLGNEEAYLAVQKEIDARKELVGLIGSKEARKAAEDSAKEAARDWERAAADINRSLTDALLRGFESGKDFAKNLRDTIVNMFQTLVLRPTISAVLSPVSTAINGVVSSGLSALGIGGQAASMAGLFGVGGGATAASFAQNVATGVSVGLSSSEAIAAATAAGQAMGASAGTGFMASLSAVPGWGWALGGVALLGGLLGGGGETRQGGQYRLDGGRAELVAGPSGGEIEGQSVRAAIEATAGGINALLKQLGSSASLAAFQAGLESSDKNRGGVFAGGTLSTGQTFGMSGGGSNYDGTMYDPSFGFSGDSKAMLTAFSAELAQTTLQALQAATDIPKAVRDQLNAVDIKGLSAEAATALATSIAQQAQDVATFREAMESLPFENLRNLSYDAAAALGTAAGGLGTLAQSLTSFANNTAFYTQAEIDARAMAELKATFAEFGQEMPTTTAGYRALVEHVAALAPTSEEAAKGLAALLANAEAFARISANAANAISNAASSAQSAASSASNKPADLAALQARFAAYNVAAPTNMFEYRALMAQAAAAAPTDALAAKGLAELEANLNTAFQLFTDAAQSAAPNWGPSFQNGGGGASEKALADWKSATDSIKSTMDDLRKTLIDETKPSLAALQAQFAVAVAQAKAGDAMAAASLPDLAKAISAAGRDQASSALEAALITARAAQALQDVLDARRVASAGPSYMGLEGKAQVFPEYERRPTWLSQPEIDENMRYAQVSIQHYLDWYVPWMRSQSPAMLPPDRASAPNPVMEPDRMYIFSNGQGGNGPGGNATEIADALAAMAERLAAIEAATRATQNATRSTADVLERASRGSQPLATQVTP